jgi:hypothetical protein
MPEARQPTGADPAFDRRLEAASNFADYSESSAEFESTYTFQVRNAAAAQLYADAALVVATTERHGPARSALPPSSMHEGERNELERQHWHACRAR